MARRMVTTAASLALAAGAASAGGIDRTGQGIGAIFEPGRYAEISFGFGSPTVNGTAPAALGGAGSGDMAPSYLTFGGAYKQDFGDKIAFALIFDQPFGADVEYPTGTGYPFAGSTAELRSNAITAVARYRFTDRMSVHAGLRYQSLGGDVNVNATALGRPNYFMSAETEHELGYLVGFAYEIPDIALRAAVTYNSAIDYNFTTSETAVGVVTDLAGTMAVTTPESVNVDFQTGIAEGTLLMASARWVNWPQFNISPSLNADLVRYDHETTSYSLGVARRFSEAFAASVAVGYEGEGGTPVGNLGPTDGYWSVTLGGVYTRDNMKVTAGVRYAMLGDATTRTISADFADNSAIGLGVKVGFSF